MKSKASKEKSRDWAFPVRRNRTVRAKPALVPSGPMSKVMVTRLAVEAQNVLSAIEDNKRLYARLDELTQILKDANLSGTGLTVIDNFSDKNTVFRPAGVRRFELKKVG